MQKEYFKDIPNNEGIYKISNAGTVMSMGNNRSRKTKILKNGIISNGYYTVGLMKNKIQKTFQIHQLVAIVFLNHKPDGTKLVVNHKNFDKLDNCLDNLEIVTHRQNLLLRKNKLSSNYAGVCWNRSTSKWRSQIRINGKKFYLGEYSNELTAHKVYQNTLNSL